MSGAMTAPDPGTMAGASPDPDADAGQDQDTDSDVVVTITRADDGSYMVYAGDEPEAGGDMSEDDSDAMGGAGNAPAPLSPSSQGQPADSIGAALKIALDIMNADKSSEGAPGNADDQFAGGFNASKSPTPATSMPQKY